LLPRPVSFKCGGTPASSRRKRRAKDLSRSAVEMDEYKKGATTQTLSGHGSKIWGLVGVSPGLLNQFPHQDDGAR
jgi:hypothetical protein